MSCTYLICVLPEPSTLHDSLASIHTVLLCFVMNVLETSQGYICIHVHVGTGLSRLEVPEQALDAVAGSPTGVGFAAL